VERIYLRLLKLFINLVDVLNEKIGLLVSWLTASMVLVVCYDVFTRYLLKESSIAVQELEWHLFAIIFLLGAAYTLKRDKHVRIDIFYMKFSHRKKAVINLIGTIIFLIPFTLLIIWTSKDFVINSFILGESSPDPGGLPARYILKACIPLSFFLLLLQGLSLAFKSILTIVGKNGGLFDE
jgi:TRAP-type mannitol/chloroaromatic compound transport system permease small subunit